MMPHLKRAEGSQYLDNRDKRDCHNGTATAGPSIAAPATARMARTDGP